MKVPPDYKTMDFLSTTFWHFISDRKNEKREVVDPSLEILLSKVLRDNATGNLLKDPGKTHFHPRKVVLERTGLDLKVAPRQNDDDPPVVTEYALKEPKAVCFADIPFNFLPIHLKAYNGIGLGFYREALLAYEKFRPVTYFPRVTMENLRDACEPFDGTPELLKPYAKIKSEKETFESIYREREWRVPDDVCFQFTELSCVVFRTDEELLRAISDSKVKKLMSYGVSMISCERHFESIVRPQ